MKWSYIKSDEDRALVEYAKRTNTESHCTWQANTLDYLLEYYNKPTFRTCIDAGASYGFLSVGFSKIFEQVVSFEINPKVYPHLEKNISTFDNIKSHNIGLYNQDTEVMINQSNSSGQNRISGDGVKVKVNTLDSFNIKNVDLIKIDVEGSEGKLIEGAKKTITKYKPILVIEMDLSRGGEHKRKNIFDFLNNLNYIVADVRHRDILFLPNE